MSCFYASRERTFWPTSTKLSLFCSVLNARLSEVMEQSILIIIKINYKGSARRVQEKSSNDR